MKRTIYAIEITLTKIECETDGFGAKLADTPTRRTALASHYDGSNARQKAKAIYARLDAVMKENRS